MRIYGVIVAGVLSCVGAPASAANLSLQDLMSSFSVIALDYWEQENANQVFGPMYVGGDAYLLGSTLNASNAGNVTLPTADGTGTLAGTLFVDGGMVGPSAPTLQNGDAQFSGAPSTPPNFNGGQAFTNVATMPTAAIKALMPDASLQLSQLSATAGSGFFFDDPGSSSPNSLTIETGAGVNGVAVINVDGDSLEKNFQNTSITLSQAAGVTTTIINISGSGPRASFGNINDFNSGVVVNWYEATAVEIEHTFGYSILAPNAAVSNSAQVRGSVVARELYQSGDILQTTFSGNLPDVTPVPLPAPAAMLAGGLALLGAAGLRRRRR